MIPYQQYLKIPVDYHTWDFIRDLVASHYTFATRQPPYGGMPKFLFDMGLLRSGPSQYEDCCAISLASEVDIQFIMEDGAWYLVIPLAPGVI